SRNGAVRLEQPMSSAPTARIPQLAVIEARQVNGFPRHSREEFDRRYAFLRRVIQQHDLSCVVVGGRGMIDSALQYFTNWPCRFPSFLLLWPDGEAELLARLWNHMP